MNTIPLDPNAKLRHAARRVAIKHGYIQETHYINESSYGNGKGGCISHKFGSQCEMSHYVNGQLQRGWHNPTEFSDLDIHLSRNQK